MWLLLFYVIALVQAYHTIEYGNFKEMLLRHFAINCRYSHTFAKATCHFHMCAGLNKNWEEKKNNTQICAQIKWTHAKPEVII